MDVQTKFNYYDILEITPQTPQNEITSSYEKLKLTYSGENPAIYTVFSLEEARQMLSMVEEAFSVLGNKVLRTQYDSQMQVSPQRSKEDLQQQIPQKTYESNKPIAKPDFQKNEKMETEIKDCESWSGEMIGKVRIYKNWTFENLSEVTKISAYYIKGIEKMESQSLPAPVFVRGYVGQLCRILNLNEKKVCDSYMKLYKERLEQK